MGGFILIFTSKGIFVPFSASEAGCPWPWQCFMVFCAQLDRAQLWKQLEAISEEVNCCVSVTTEGSTVKRETRVCCSQTHREQPSIVQYLRQDSMPPSWPPWSFSLKNRHLQKPCWKQSGNHPANWSKTTRRKVWMYVWKTQGPLVHLLGLWKRELYFL